MLQPGHERQVECLRDKQDHDRDAERRTHVLLAVEFCHGLGARPCRDPPIQALSQTFPHVKRLRAITITHGPRLASHSVQAYGNSLRAIGEGGC
jgi:hypothetical protein